MNNEFKYMKEGITSDLLEYLMADYQLGIQDSLRYIYESEAYSKLCEPATGLYAQSSRYNYSYLKDEVATGRMQ